MTRPGSVTATLLAAALLAAGCAQGDPGSATATPTDPPSASQTPGDPTICRAVTTTLLGSVQRYIDTYGSTLSSDSSASDSGTAGDDTELRDTLQRTREDLQAKGCDFDTFREQFATGMDGITARGPLATAVLLRLTASMTGTLATTAQTVTLRPSDDLGRKLAALAPGSTARLVAGTYRLEDPLVLLAGVTLVGAGRGRTTLSSKAGGSALLVLTDGRVELRDLTAVHVGKQPASVLVGGPSSSVVLTSVRVSGARTSKAKNARGQGGSGVTMTARADDTTARGTTLEVTRSVFSDNGAAGILLTGAHRASIRSSRFTANGQCGVCFAGVSSGAVRGSTFTGNAVGVAVFDQAGPAITDDTFTNGQVGVQVAGSGAPIVKGARIKGPSRAGMIFSDTSSGRVTGSKCTDVPYGIVVGPKSYPYLGKNSCLLATGR